jgi:WD40 repeat protein
VLLERVSPPIGFRSIQAADLVGWDGTDASEAFARLVRDVVALMGPPRQPDLPKKRTVRKRPSGALGEKRLALDGHENMIRGLAFSPDSSRIAAAGETKVKIWDAEAGTLLRTFDLGTGNMVDQIAFSRDGRLLVTSSKDEKMVVSRQVV